MKQIGVRRLHFKLKESYDDRSRTSSLLCEDMGISSRIDKSGVFPEELLRRAESLFEEQ